MRSPLRVTQGANGPSAWLVLDYLQRPFNVALFAAPSEDANLTYTVEHTPDNPNDMGNVASLTRAGTVATLTTLANHGLKVGDSVVVISAGDDNLNGTFGVASTPSPTTLTYAVANTGAAAGTGNTKVALLRVFPHEFMAAQTTRMDGNYGFPVMATRINVSNWVAGQVTLDVVQGLARG